MKACVSYVAEGTRTLYAEDIVKIHFNVGQIKQQVNSKSGQKQICSQVSTKVNKTMV